MKTKTMLSRFLTTGVVLSALALASGCARGESPAPTTFEAEGARLVPGDIAPGTLYQHASESLPGDLVTESTPVSPKTFIGLPARPGTMVFRDTMISIARGSKETEIAIPIDATDDATIYVIPQTSEPKTQDDVAGGVQVFAPAALAPLSAYATKPLVDDTQPGTLTAKLSVHKPVTTLKLDASSKPGVFNVKLGKNATEQGVMIDVRMPSSKIAMSVTPSASQYLLGQQGSMRVKLVDGDAPVLGAKLESELLLPNGTRGAKLGFRELGGGDYEVVLSDTLGEKDPTGVYSVYVRATGEVSGKKFNRLGYGAIGFAIPTAKISAVSAPRAIKDESGKIVAFEADIALDVASSDRFEVSATLTAPTLQGERPLVEAQSAAVFGAGKHTITLRFDARFISLTKLEGSFALRKLQLFSQSQNMTFHRISRGLDVRFPKVKTLELATTTEIPPAVEEMITNGELDLTKK